MCPPYYGYCPGFPPQPYWCPVAQCWITLPWLPPLLWTSTLYPPRPQQYAHMEAPHARVTAQAEKDETERRIEAADCQTRRLKETTDWLREQTDRTEAALRARSTRQQPPLPPRNSQRASGSSAPPPSIVERQLPISRPQAKTTAVGRPPRSPLQRKRKLSPAPIRTVKRPRDAHMPPRARQDPASDDTRRAAARVS